MVMKSVHARWKSLHGSAMPLILYVLKWRYSLMTKSQGAVEELCNDKFDGDVLNEKVIP